MKITCKYGGHRTNDDQSCRVSFNRPDGLKYYVNMPAKFNGPGVGVLDWIESEGIEIYRFESGILHNTLIIWWHMMNIII